MKKSPTDVLKEYASKVALLEAFGTLLERAIRDATSTTLNPAPAPDTERNSPAFGKYEILTQTANIAGGQEQVKVTYERPAKENTQSRSLCFEMVLDTTPGGEEAETAMQVMRKLFPPADCHTLGGNRKEGEKYILQSGARIVLESGLTAHGLEALRKRASEILKELQARAPKPAPEVTGEAAASAQIQAPSIATQQG